MTVAALMKLLEKEDPERTVLVEDLVALQLVVLRPEIVVLRATLSTGEKVIHLGPKDALPKGRKEAFNRD